MMWINRWTRRSHCSLVLAVLTLGGCSGGGPVKLAPAPPTSAASAEAPAAKPTETLEATDPELVQALAAAKQSRTCESLVAVADRYYQRRVLDLAAAYYGEAVVLPAGCATAHAGLARAWRDSGYGGRALASSHRAVHADRTSPVAWNTLGTVLQDLGQYSEARAAYERAAALDPAAAYPRSNLCYLAFLEGDIARAESLCLAGVAADADYAPAKNNLALLYAAVGDTAKAFETFRAAVGAAAAHYNLGLVWLARRDYKAALEAFEAAYREDPTFDAAHARARDVRRLLKLEKTNGEPRRSDR